MDDIVDGLGEIVRFFVGVWDVLRVNKAYGGNFIAVEFQMAAWDVIVLCYVIGHNEGCEDT
jgi:hypothetical protein